MLNPAAHPIANTVCFLKQSGNHHYLQGLKRVVSLKQAGGLPFSDAEAMTRLSERLREREREGGTDRTETERQRDTDTDTDTDRQTEADRECRRD